MQSRPHFHLYKREENLIALLGAFGDGCEPNGLPKDLFFVFFCKTYPEGTQNVPLTSSYEFVPYKYGAFSFTSNHDRNRLTARGILKESEAWSLTEFGEHIAADLQNDHIKQFAQTYARLRGDRLISESYREDPYYAIRSEIIGRILRRDQATRRRIEEMASRHSNHVLYTIGYEKRSLESYLNVLLKNSISCLCDVRRNPVCRRYGFSKRTLHNACESMGIKYFAFP